MLQFLLILILIASIAVMIYTVFFDPKQNEQIRKLQESLKNHKGNNNDLLIVLLCLWFFND